MNNRTVFSKHTTKALFASLLLLLLSLLCTSCGRNPADDEKLRIVATVFSEYDWVREILGDNPAGAELTLLTEKGVDMHSYQPSTGDLLKIAKCDLFLYVGGESDAWVQKALSGAKNDRRIAVNLLGILGSDAREEELVEGMEHGDDHANDDRHADGDRPDSDSHDADSDGDSHGGDASRGENRGNHGEGGIEYDEHVWLSLRNAAKFVTRISESLQTLDPKHAETYKKNAEAYLAKLSALDAQYKEAVDAAPVKTLLFGDRFPFRYLTGDYGLSYYAAFAGCSAETEASFSTVTFLAGKLDELDLPAVLTIEGSDSRLAETILRTAGQDSSRAVLSLNSLQSVTRSDIDAGVTYIGVMTDNLAVLRRALGL
ncbi:MAG: metal ABC transporter substrate-binding protein [Lachnospiraceae bacterium]|nr:metal ABC transporter substrate-binding protein [Lachnospiraceae bacterium]